MSLFFEGVLNLGKTVDHFGLIDHLVHFSVAHVQSVQFGTGLRKHIELVIDSQTGVENSSHEVIMAGRPETLSGTGTLALTIHTLHFLQIPHINVSIEIAEASHQD